MTASLGACAPSGEPDLIVRIDRARGVLSVSGEMDAATAPRLVEAAAALDRRGDLTVDLHGLAFIGAAGLNALVGIRIAQESGHRELCLAGVSPKTARVFRAGGLAGMVASAPTTP